MYYSSAYSCVQVCSWCVGGWVGWMWWMVDCRVTTLRIIPQQLFLLSTGPARDFVSPTGAAAYH